MAHSYHHAVSSARKWGGAPDDYQSIHDWLAVIWTRKPFVPLFGGPWSIGGDPRRAPPSSDVMFLSSVGAPFLRPGLRSHRAPPTAAVKGSAQSRGATRSRLFAASMASTASTGP